MYVPTLLCVTCDVLFTRLTQIYMYMGVRSIYVNIVISKDYPPCQISPPMRLSKSVVTHFWCQAIWTTVLTETRI